MKNNRQKFVVFFSLMFIFGFGCAQENKSAENIMKTESTTSFADQIIVAVTEARIRAAPNLKAKILGATQIGTVFDVKGKTGDWYQVIFNGGRGWISTTIVKNFNASKRAEIYSELADKYLTREDPKFDEASEVFQFLSKMRTEIEQPEAKANLSLKRFLALKAALNAIPFDKLEQKPFKEFVEKNKDEIVYSEPGGQWLVVSEKIWDLSKKYKSLPIADEIAWQAAQNYLPGECEGYTNCYLYIFTLTEGKYLDIYPNGNHNKEALKTILNSLEAMTTSDESKGYEGPIDEDKADFTQSINKLRTIIAKVPLPEHQKVLKSLDRLVEKYK